LNSTN